MTEILCLSTSADLSVSSFEAALSMLREADSYGCRHVVRLIVPTSLQSNATYIRDKAADGKLDVPNSAVIEIIYLPDVMLNSARRWAIASDSGVVVWSGLL